MLLDMVVEGMPDRVVIGHKADGLTGTEIKRRAQVGAGIVQESGADVLMFLGGNGPSVPVALFAASYAGVPFLPVNFRLSADQLDDILGRQKNPLIITDT